MPVEFFLAWFAKEGIGKSHIIAQFLFFVMILSNVESEVQNHEYIAPFVCLLYFYLFYILFLSALLVNISFLYIVNYF